MDGKKALQVVYVELDKLIPYVGNSRTHSKEQVNQIAASIKEFGFTNPVLVDEHKGIVAGHGRVMAAEKLQLAKVPVIELAHLSEAQKKAYIIADNKLALNAGWNEEMLANELAALQEFDFDLALTGFSEEELNDLLPDVEEVKTGLTDDEAVPQVSEQIVTVQGDVWVMDGHRLICGDATDTETIKKLIGDKKIDLVFSDPPYGIDVVQSSQVGGGGPTKFGKVGSHNIVESRTYSKIIGDETTETARAFYAACLAMEFKNIIIWGGNYFTDFLSPSRCWVIWDKEMTGNFSEAEMAWTSFSKGGVSIFKHLWNGLSREGNRKDELRTRVHPTQKPVGLFYEIFKRFDGFKAIFDGFGGSGSTLIACEKAGNTCYMVEMEPKYCDVIVRRWQDYTGKKAVLEATGETFDGSK